MEKCLLCKNNDADKTGSHIIPHFLSKRIDNEEGESGRDKELGFVIGINNTRMYFGRGILPEKLNEVYGDVDDELLESNVNEGIVNNIFCTHCEKRFASIENEYAKTLKVFSEPKSIYISNNKYSFLGFLFWVSIAWRLAIMPGSGYKLKEKEQNKLRRILDKYLNLDIDDIYLDAKDFDISDIGYKILRAPNFSDTTPTFQYTDPYFGQPYFFMVDEFIIFFYFKKNYMKNRLNDYFGSLYLEKEAPYNTPFNCEHIYSIELPEFKEIISKMLSFLTDKKFQLLSKNLDAFHRMTFPNQGTQMDPRLKAEVFRNITTNEEKLGKQNLRNDIEIIVETVQKFYNIPD